MKKNFFSYLFIFILTIFFLIVVYISFDSNLRRKILSLSSGLINNYYEISIEQSLLTTDPDINKAIKKLEEQIKVSEYLTNNSKNSFLDNIFLNARKIEKFINTDSGYRYFSGVVKKITEKDSEIYLAIVWQAKMMQINNSKDQDVISKINEAIELSPANLEAYKFALEYTFAKNKNNLFKKYCSMYHSSILGGSNVKNKPFFLQSNSLSKFSLQIESNYSEEDFYIIDGISLNKTNDYNFTLKKSTNLNSLNLFMNFYPGTLMKITSIELTNVDNEKIKLPLKEAYLSTRNSFFQHNTESLELITASNDSDRIKIKFDKMYEDVIKITINLKFTKLNLTNQPGC